MNRVSTSFVRIVVAILFIVSGAFGSNAAANVANTSQVAIDVAGLWMGTWERSASSRGKITVTLSSGGTASFVVVDSDKERTVYRFKADWTAAGKTITIKARGFNRVDTYNLQKTEKGLVLKGSYVFKGRHWANVRMEKIT